MIGYGDKCIEDKIGLDESGHKGEELKIVVEKWGLWITTKIVLWCMLNDTFGEELVWHLEKGNYCSSKITSRIM